MSNWTHVAAVARIDSFRELGFRTEKDVIKYFGNEVRYGSKEKIWIDADKNPDKYLPMGSEGSLRMIVWDNPSKDCMSAFTVSIFGDLRDHDDPNEIVEWFKDKLKNCKNPIRQATITVHNEVNGTVNWTDKEFNFYNEEEEDNE